MQLDYDEEMEPLYGMYGSMEAEYEVQRTIKRAEHHQEGGADGLLMPSQESDRTHQGACDNKGTIDGLRKGEKECIKPRAVDADLWMKIWEKLHGLVEMCILAVREVRHGRP